MDFKGFSSIDMMGFEDSNLPDEMFRNKRVSVYNDLVSYFAMSGKECMVKTMPTAKAAKIEQSRITNAIIRTGLRDKCSCCVAGNKVYIVNQPMREYRERKHND